MNVKTPKGSEEVLSPTKETVSTFPNKGNCVEAQPTVDAGVDSGVGAWNGDGAKVVFEKA
jgi:hypothetical protein